MSRTGNLLIGCALASIGVAFVMAFVPASGVGESIAKLSLISLAGGCGVGFASSYLLVERQFRRMIPSKAQRDSI